MRYYVRIYFSRLISSAHSYAQIKTSFYGALKLICIFEKISEPTRFSFDSMLINILLVILPAKTS